MCGNHKVFKAFYFYKNIKMKLLLFAIFSFTSLAGKTQKLLIPSKKAFEKRWVKKVFYEMDWYALKDTTKFEIGKVTTQILTDDKYLTVVTKVSMKNMKAPWVDTTVAEINTLKPIRHSSYNVNRDMALNFEKVVNGFYNDKMKKTNSLINDTTKSDYFDSNLYPVLLGWLPLKNNYKQDISIYDYNPLAKIGVIKVSVKNVISGTYETDKNGRRNVWIVTVTDEIGNGGNGAGKYYFDKVDRKLWKQEIDAKGRKMIMKLVE